MEGIGQAQRQRLEHIDFCLFFLGEVSRSILMDRFDISSAAATRDLTRYKEDHPKNIVYDSSQKEYAAAAGFQPAFNHDVYEALRAFSKPTEILNEGGSLVLSDRPIELNCLNPKIVSNVGRAIHQQKLLKVKYFSVGSGLSERIIAPFAFVDTGVKWHIRAFDRKRNLFADFLVSRIKECSVLDESPRLEERPEKDIQWNRIVEMEIVPHPLIEHPETILHEYGIGEEGVLHINARAAVVGYFLRRWNIDCGRQPDKSPDPGFQLWLKNSLTLYGVETIKLAPNYKEPE